MSFLEIKLRKLPSAEKAEILSAIPDLQRRCRERRPPGPTYRRRLNQILAGRYYRAEPNLPPWLHHIWNEDSLIDPRTPVRQDFDTIIANCDLSRLAFFIRTREGQSIREYLKLAWSRVTLGMESSIYSLFDADYSVICFDSNAIYIVKDYSGPEPLTEAEAHLELYRRLQFMAHNDE